MLLTRRRAVPISSCQAGEREREGMRDVFSMLLFRRGRQFTIFPAKK